MLCFWSPEVIYDMTLYKLPLVLDPQPEGGYVVTCPLVPELLTEGDTVEEALHHANDALEAVIEGYEALGRPLPPALQLAQENAPIRLETALALLLPTDRRIPRWLPIRPSWRRPAQSNPG